MAPGLALVVLALYLPVLYTVYLSFTDYYGPRTPESSAAHNYAEMFSDTGLPDRHREHPDLGGRAPLLVPVGLGLLVAYLAFGLRGPRGCACRSSSLTRCRASRSA